MEQPPIERAVPSTPAAPGAAGARVYVSNRTWLWNHIGRLAGLLLGAIAIAFLIFLALLGSKDALGLIVVLAAGITMIAVGGAMRGQMRSH